MAAIEYIVPGGGIVNDTETESEVIIPGMGIFNEQAAAVGGVATGAELMAMLI